MTKFFPKSTRRRVASKLDSLTMRDFGGGLNTAEEDLNLSPRFCPDLLNFRRTSGGGQKIRYGSKWFSDVAGTVQGDIVDSEYFSDVIISVTTAGEIAAIDNEGAVAAIWNETIANALPGSPAGWSSNIDSVDFVPHRNDLIIHNGVDKPIIIDSDLVVTYLVDEATGSNTNTPIGKYGCVVSNFHCVAGIPAEPTVIEISSEGTSGTFVGDPAPNNAISIDVGAYASEGLSDIRGIAGYRSNLIVFFRGHSVIIGLGTFDADDVHTPSFPDTFPRFGLLGHRCITSTENDLIFAGLDCAASAKRNLLSASSQIESERLSAHVEPTYKKEVGVLDDDEMLKSCFVVNDRLSHDIWFSMPDQNDFIYSSDDKLRYKSWSTFNMPAWRSGCTSFQGRVFLSLGTKIFQSGNGVHVGEAYSADKVLDRDRNWATNTAFSAGELVFDEDTEESYECLAGHISGTGTFAEDREAQAASPFWALYEGEPITFRMELPWADGRNPMQVKQLRFISCATKGTAEFTLKAYVDNLYKDADGTIIHDPALSIEMIGNDAPGFGEDAGPYGGGRRSKDPRLQGFPLKFKEIKFVIEGEDTKPLQMNAISTLFSRGRFKR